MSNTTITTKEYNRLLRNSERWRLVSELVEHVDDHDAQPVFEIDLECDWRLANGSKGFEKCVDAALNHYDTY